MNTIRELQKDKYQATNKINLAKSGRTFIEYGSDVKPVISKAEVLNF